MKKVIVIITVLFVAFVIADYCELFVAVYVDGGKPVPFHFRLRDHKSGSYLSGVIIKSPIAYNDGDRIMKSVREESDGVFRGAVLVGYGYRGTFLFKKDETPWKNQRIEFTFTHPSYRTETKTFLAKELAKTQTVELTPGLRFE